MIRLCDVLLAFIGLTAGLPVILCIYVIGLFEGGSPLFFQERVGKNRKPFVLVKFRTMSIGTESLASHLASASSITRWGSFLRKTKLDELPQLWNVLKGEMSLVGPRPGLFNQEELIKSREALGVYEALPGITGRAQVMGIDMSTPERLAKVDSDMIAHLTLKQYFKYIFLTILGKGNGDAIK